jgi:hypothetical protein
MTMTRVAHAAGVLVLAVAAPAVGQSAGPTWLDWWGPLARVDLPRRLPSPGSAAATLLWPDTRIGSFWTAGNPAALRSELTDTRSDFGIGFGTESGTYRRPLDPGERGLTQASASSGKPMTDRFALLGRGVVDQERFDPGSQADAVEPYPSSPFVTIDTATSATRRTRARLEGVGSWQFGRIGLGLALGYQTRSHETIEAGFVRRTRQTLPGAGAGLTWQVGGVRLGAYGRWTNRAETIRLLERTAQGKVVQLQGLKEVPVLDIQNAFYRRADEDAGAAGLSASGGSARWTWVAFGQRTRLRERLTRQETDDPANDRWDADGWVAGGALQRSLGRRRLVTADLRYTSLTGAADVALDSAAAIFEATERELAGRAELRVAPDTTGWGLAVGVNVRSERRLRNDLAVTLGSRVNAMSVGLDVEIARALSPSALITASLAVANYSANSALPAPSALGTIYRTWHLPELDLASRQARPILGAVGGRWRVSSRSSLWMVLRGERLAPAGSVDPTPFGPEGSRTAVSVAAGVTVR